MGTCKISGSILFQRYQDLKAMLEEEYEDEALVKLVRRNVSLVEPVVRKARRVRNPLGDRDATQDEDEDQARADLLEEYGAGSSSSGGGVRDDGESQDL